MSGYLNNEIKSNFIKLSISAYKLKLMPLKHKGWFSLAHKHNISITSENTRNISRNIRRTNPLICLMLFSLTHKHKRKCIGISISARKTNMFVFLVLMLMLMRE